MRAANRAEPAKAAVVDEKGRKRNAARKARRLAEKQAASMPVVEPLDGPRMERVVDAKMVAPAPRGGIVEVMQQPYLLRLIVGRELASMYAASLLGLLWSYIQPAMRFTVYYIVMGVILKLHQGVPYFAIHLFCGIVFMHYFTETWNGGTRSIWVNRTLVLKMRLPREIFPVASMVVASYHTFPQIILLMFCCLVCGWHVSVMGVLALLLGLAILISFAMAAALFFSALNVFFRDFQNIVQTMLQFMHFLVPMMYPFQEIWAQKAPHPMVYQVYMANPLATVVMLTQKMFWWGVVPDTRKDGNYLLSVTGGSKVLEFPPDLWERGWIMLGIGLVMLLLSQRFFSRVEGKFPERM